MPSILENLRLAYHPLIPQALENLRDSCLCPSKEQKPLSSQLLKLFPKTNLLQGWRLEKGKNRPNRPLKIGVFFSGGQAPGGHNVLAGLFDGIHQIHPESQLIGYLDGPSGLIENRKKQLTKEMIDSVRNLGGFDLIGSGRTKIETADQFESAAQNIVSNHLDALVVIGGDDSNTNAALLAEYLLQKNLTTSVIGIPKTIDGDLRSPDIEISFGFDSATKTYSEMIGNIERDAISAKKYYHFIKLMGRSASHIALECALQTRPNLTIIGEERQSLSKIVQDIANMVEERKKIGKEFGVILLPEGLIEFIPEFKILLAEINQKLSTETDAKKIHTALSHASRTFFSSLPEKIQSQLFFERDPHGNVQLSQIETEYLILELVKEECKRRNLKLNALSHFFGYEGRSCLPSNFDANYCYALGLFASIAARDKATGVILAMRHLKQSPHSWEPAAVPIVQLMDFEMRSGKEKPVIIKALVRLDGKSYRNFVNERIKWRSADSYQNPGPIQFFGDPKLTDSIPATLS